MMWALALTLLVWTGAVWLARFGRGWVNPVLVSTIVIVVVLLVTRAPLAEYQEGTLPLDGPPRSRNRRAGTAHPAPRA